MGEMVIGGCLNHSHNEMLDFKMFDMRNSHQSCHQGFWKGRLPKAAQAA